MPRPRKYPQELIDRGVRLAIESGRPIAHVAADIGLPPETLRKRVRQAQADQGLGPDLPTSEEREEIKQLKRENYELRRANEILKAASVYFAIELDADRPR
jgi:transposase